MIEFTLALVCSQSWERSHHHCPQSFLFSPNADSTMTASTPYPMQARTEFLTTSDGESSPLHTKPTSFHCPTDVDYVSDSELPPFVPSPLVWGDSFSSTISGYSSSSGSSGSATPFSPNTATSSSSDNSSSGRHSHSTSVPTLANTKSKKGVAPKQCLECEKTIHGNGLSNHIRDVHLHKGILTQYPNAALWPYEFDWTRKCYKFAQVSAEEALRRRGYLLQTDDNGAFFTYSNGRKRCPLDQYRCPVRKPTSVEDSTDPVVLSVHGASQAKKRKQSGEAQSVHSATLSLGQPSLPALATGVPSMTGPAPQQSCTFQPAIFICSDTFAEAKSSSCEMEFALTTEHSHFANGAALCAVLGPQALQRVGVVVATAASHSPLVFSFPTNEILELLRLHEGMLRWRPLPDGSKECEVPVSVYAARQVMWFDATAFHVRVVDPRGTRRQVAVDSMQLDVLEQSFVDLASIDSASSTSSSSSSSSPSLSATASPAGSSTPPTRQHPSWSRGRIRPPAIITNHSAYGSRAADELVQAEPVCLAVANACAEPPQLSLVSSNTDNQAMHVSSFQLAVVEHCRSRAACNSPRQAISPRGNLSPATLGTRSNIVSPLVRGGEGYGKSWLINLISSKTLCTSTPTCITNYPAAAPHTCVKARGKPRRQRGREFRPASRGRGWYVDLAVQPATANKVAVNNTQGAFTQPFPARGALPNITVDKSPTNRLASAIPPLVDNAVKLKSTSVPQLAAFGESALLKAQPPQPLTRTAFNHQSLSTWGLVHTSSSEIPLFWGVYGDWWFSPPPAPELFDFLDDGLCSLAPEVDWSWMDFPEPMEQKLPNKAQIVQLGEQIQRLERERIERREKVRRLHSLSIRHDSLNLQHQHRSPVSSKLDSLSLLEPLDKVQTTALSARMRSNNAPLTNLTLRQRLECDEVPQMRSVSKPNDRLILEQQPLCPLSVSYLIDLPGLGGEDWQSEAQTALWNEGRWSNNAPLGHPERQDLHNISSQLGGLTMQPHYRSHFAYGLGAMHSSVGTYPICLGGASACIAGGVACIFVAVALADVGQQDQRHVSWASPISSSASSTDGAPSLHEKRRRLLRRIQARRQPTEHARAAALITRSG